MTWSSTATVSNPDIARSNLTRETKVYPIPLTDLRVWDAMHTLLPNSAAADDCALITGTPGTDAPTIQSGDVGAATISRKFAFQFGLPPEYDDGQSVMIRVKAGMLTTVADNYSRVDFSAYEADRSGAVGSDLVTTAATSINSLTFADYDFVVTSTSLAAGDLLIVVGTLESDDAGDLGVMTPEIAALEMVLAVKG